jgi:GntR family transcriptional regulator/MocR family aminotransferase
VTGVPSNPQAVVADFMDEGHFAAHIRRMRKLYAERHDALLEAARDKLGGLLDVVATDTGLHTIGILPHGVSETEVSAAALARNITAVPFQRFCIEPVDRAGLVLGFSGVGISEIRRGVDILADSIAHARSAP